MKVLIVEDNVDAANTLGELLGMWQYQVAKAHDGARALQVAHEFIPDVVLLDIGLPVLNGYQVAKRIREDFALTGTIIAAMTAYNQDESQLQANGARFDHYFVKPLDLHVLYDFLLTAQCAQT